jgi:hypothetical protein
MKQFLFLICFLILTASCKEVFEAPPKSLLKATFYNSATDKAVKSSVTLLGVGLENLLFRDTIVDNALFPLTIKDTTRYIIWLDSKSDSITFVHQTTQKYASVETGFYYEYNLLSVRFTHNRIDSIKIVDRLVTKKWNENIKLYIRPLPAGGN